ncbi:MAG TPA: Yip1 family protein [Burkholderiaceae bacterium]|nr:Yip1 family protein [Burkholderiaceae bacterium]
MASVVERAKAMLMSPRTEWPVVAAEPSDIASIYRNYLIWLAAIPAIATFIGFSVIGVGAFGVTYRVPLASGLVNAVFGWLVSLAMFYVLAMIANALAPTFQGQKDQVAAFKLIAYGSTAALVAGVVYLIPMLSILALLGALYSVYLIYLGVPVMMRTPPNKALPYTAVLVIAGFAVGLLMAMVSALFAPTQPGPATAGAGGASQAGSVSLKTPGGEISIDTGRLEEWARRMEQSAKRIEEASQRGDSEAAGKAAGEVLAALAGAGQREPVAGGVLKAALPEALASYRREAFETRSGTVLGVAGTTANARYRDGERRVTVTLTDAGGLAALAGATAWLQVSGERETDSEVSRTYRQGERTIHERRLKDGSRVEYRMVLANGIVVDLEGGAGVRLDDLKRLVDGIGVDRLETATPIRKG